MSVLVVLDTNMVVSAGILPYGHPARIADAALSGAIAPVACPAITGEYIEMVNQARFTKWKFPPQWLNAMITGAHQVDQDLPSWPPADPDRDDLIFLVLAHRTGTGLATRIIADYLKGIRHGVVAIDPATYVRHLEALAIRW